MEIRMYECGFGDCFRLREANQVDLYVDFGIHSSSWSGNDKTNRFDNIIADMNEKKDFLLEKGRIKLNPQQLWIFEKTI